MTSEAYKELGPANQTALAPRPEQQSPSLVPATNEQFRNELTACLALVVPVGMTEDARREWLSVAWKTLDHLPPDILAKGCAVARTVCDHPSKIVPTIIAETEDWMKMRRSSRDSVSSALSLPAPTKRDVMDRRGEAMTEDDCVALNAQLESLGATARYRADGSRYTLTGNA